MKEKSISYSIQPQYNKVTKQIVLENVESVEELIKTKVMNMNGYYSRTNSYFDGTTALLVAVGSGKLY